MPLTPASAISGLISGIQYRDLVDQIILAETAPATRLRAQATQLSTKLAAVTTYRGLLEKLRDASKVLRDGSVFDKLSASTAIAAGSRVLASATASSLAVAGSYRVEVTQLAQQQKLGGGVVTGTAVPLGIAGTFSVNDTGSVTVLATDSLSDIRDRINAANAGVTASIIGVGPNQSRLVLTSKTAGDAGITLADTSGNALQSLGILSDATTIAPAAVLVAGMDALFTVDGVAFTTTTNVITTAIEGVTLTLTSAEAGAVTTVSVDRSVADARTAMQGFVDAYNAVGDFIRQQQTAPPEGGTAPPLFGDNLVRGARAGLSAALLASIGATAPDLSTAAMAGLSIDRAGKLTLNGTRFDAAYTDRLDDLRALFQQHGTTTDPTVFFVTSTSRTTPGTYAVEITQAPTQSQVTGTGLGGSYADDGTPDTMTITDTGLAKSVDVTLTGGMTSSQVVDALNAAFVSGGLGLSATEVAGEVRITQSAFGSTPAITVAYTAGGTLGNAPIAAGSYATGVDVAGTIGGFAANGSGQILIAAAGSAPEGISIRYGGTATGAGGDVTVVLGTGALLERLTQSYTDSGTGALATRETGTNARIARLSDRAQEIEDRLVVRRENLLRQFARMEQALARLQSQSQSLLSSLGALIQAGSGQ